MMCFMFPCAQIQLCVWNQQKFVIASSVRLNCRGQCCFTEDVLIGAVTEREREGGVAGGGVEMMGWCYRRREGLHLVMTVMSEWPDCTIWHHIPSLTSHLSLFLSLYTYTFFLSFFLFVLIFNLHLSISLCYLFDFLLLFHFLLSGERQT